MINYTRILDINLIIMITALVNGIYIDFFEKNKNIKFINLLFFVEVLLNFFIFEINYKIANLEICLINIYIFIKVIYLFFIKKRIKFNNIKFLFLLLLNIVSLILIFNNLKLYILVNILVNLFMYKIFIFNNMKIKKEQREINISKLKYLSKNIGILNSQIAKESIVQNDFKEDIKIIEKNINKSIEEAEMPIVILDKNNKIIYCNTKFWKSITLDKIDILTYIDKNFKNGKACVDMISTIENNSFKCINIYDNENKVYRFICTKETRNDKEIKICIFNDITESTFIQNQLKDSEEKYRKLMDVLTDGVIIHNLREIQYINNAAIKILKIKSNKGDFNLETLKSKIRKEDMKQLNESLYDVKYGKINKCINKIKTIDDIFIEVITTKIEVDNINILLSIVVDITEMEEAIKKLESNQKTYMALAQNLPDGIIVIDKKTNEYIYQNESMMKILKNIKIDKINKFINNYVSKQCYGENKRYEIDKNKSCFISLNIIDRKEQNQLLAIVRLLKNEERVLEAIKELDLVNAQNYVKNEFLINTSKLLREPVKNVDNINNILEQNESKFNSKHIKNYIKLVKQNCYRLKRLINNMNEIADIENGLCEVKIVHCDIINLIKKIVYCLNEYLDDKGVKIKFKSNINYGVLKIDLEKLIKVFLNLISNSIKFSKNESLIEVTVNRTDSFINIYIKDNGVGIPKDKLKFIFTKFGQVDKTLSRNTEGCGVGLTLVKNYLKLQNGYINVNSKEGYGSEFIITLKEFKDIGEKNLLNISNLNQYIFEQINIEFSDIYF